ncbi:MAG TPA: VirB3 family type IV secretion system protein [Noviherbaspirillum sp.]|nr:VirB3 family type IV secretion system protein [Noviherbaspirillum sp.]
MKDEEELIGSTVIRAAQRPPMWGYVPLNCLLIELLILFMLFAFLGLWALCFLPVHIIPMVWTNKDMHWMRTMSANYEHWWFASNKGLKSKTALTFTCAPIRNKKSTYGDIE